MNAIQYNVTAGGVAYAGSLTVLLKDVNSNTVYSGSAATWSSTLSVLSFPLSITVTPNVTYQVFTQTGIASMTNLQIPLTSSPTSPISYAVLVAGAVYNGAINVVITDNLSATVYTGTAQTYSTSILSSRFPISITVTPTTSYQTQTISNITNATSVQITL
jgi:hypothetical protein